MNPIKYEDLVKPDESINNAISQLEQLMKGYESALETVKSGAISLKASMSGVSSVTAEGRKGIKKAASETEIFNKAATTSIQKYKDAAVKIVNLKIIREGYVKGLKNEQLLHNETVENLKKLKIQYAIQKDLLDGVALSERGVSESSREMIAELQTMATEIARLEKQTSALKETKVILTKQEKLDLEMAKATEDSYEALSIQYELNTLRLNKMTVAQRDNSEEGRKLTLETQAIAETLNRLDRERKAVKADLTKEQKLEIAFNEAANGSYYKMAAQYALNTIQLDRMTESQRLNSEEGIALTKETKELADTMAKLDKTRKASKTDEDRLTEAMQKREDATSEVGRAIREQALEQKKETDILSLIIKLNSATEGSYNELSAQYALNVKRLDDMTVSQRENTEEGIRLTKETKDMADIMSKLDKSRKTSKTDEDRLTEAMQKRKDATSATSQAIHEQSVEQKKESDLMKLTFALNSAAEGSYDKLSAQYAINKLKLNAMTKAEREETEQGKDLVKSTKAIYEEMHRLQSETGKNALKVGSYNEAVDRLKDSFGDWKSKLIETGGNTAKLSALMGEATSAVMGLASACWAFVATPIGAVIAVIVVAVVALVAIFSKAIDVARGNEEQSAKLSRALTVLKVAVSLVTKYFEGLADTVIKGIEVMAEMTEAVLRFIGMSEEASKKIQELMKIEADRLALYKKIREANEQNAKDEGLVAELRTKNAEKEKYTYKQRIGFLDEAIAKERDIAERNVAVAKEKLRIMEVDYSLVKKSTEQENALSEARIAVIDATTKMNIQTREMAEGRSEAINQMNTDRKAALDEAQKMDDEEIKRRRDAQDLITSLMAEGQAKQIAINKQAFDRKAQDLDREIQKSEEARISEEKFYEELNIKSFRKELHLTKEQIKEMQMMKGDYLDKAAFEENKIVRASSLDRLSYERWQLETSLEEVVKFSEAQKTIKLQLLKNQMDAEILLNADKTQEGKAKELEIRAKYNNLILRAEQDFDYEVGLRKFDIAQAFAQSEFDLLRNSERAKTEFRLKSERDRLQKLLDLDKNASDKMTEQQRKTIENQIKLYNREIGKVTKKKDIYELLGIKLDDDQKKAIADSVNYALSAFQSILSANVELADMAVQKANERVAASQTAVEKEIEARNNGYANNLELAQKELDRNKKDQAEALALKKQAAKDQQMLDTAMQASSLITATAQIWAALSGVGPLGWVLALAAVGTMWGSFAAAKIKANEVTNKTTYGKGGYEFLRGGSHASGNDIPLGTMADGSQRTAEGGEFFAIINKKSTNKYRGVLPDLVDSLNRGIFEDKYASMFSGADKRNVVVNVNSNTSKLEREVGLIRQATESRKQIYHAPDGSVVETYKNLKRTVYVQSPN